MRQWILGLGSVCVAAGIVAVASLAHDRPVRLTPAQTRLELTNSMKPASTVLRVEPPGAAAVDGSELFGCSNAHYRPNVGCQSWPGNISLEGDTVKVVQSVAEAGHYEIGVRVPTRNGRSVDHWNTSNIAVVTIVDPCRWIARETTEQGPVGATLAGAPIPCSGDVKGRYELRGEDGTLHAINGRVSRSLLSQRVTGLAMPVLRLAAYGQAATLRLRSGPRIGSLLTEATTPAAIAVSWTPADVSITHANRRTTVKVHRGVSAVYSPSGRFSLYRHISGNCKGRPSAACFKRIRYRVGGYYKRWEYAKVLRAGQSASFNYRGAR